MINLKDLYDTNEDFRDYVEECRKYDNRSVEEELELATVKETAEYYISKERN